MSDWMELTDELGPASILHVYEPETGLEGVVVVDTVMMGLTGGGTRMTPDITTEEVFGLARAMTHKMAILDLPVGGAKAGIRADPGIAGDQRRALLHAFGRRVQPLLASGVTLAADIGTNADDVAGFYEGAGLESGFSGLSTAEIHGEPLENHATGYGVVVAAEAACEAAGLDIGSATAAIEGFGKVGGGAARYLADRGATLTAVSTVEGALYDPTGLDVDRLLELRRSHGDRVVREYPGGRLLAKEELYGLPVDILMPGARAHVVDEGNVDRVRARVVSSIANIPITAAAEEALFRRGVRVVPDFISNAGGVTVAVLDQLGGGVDDVFRAIERVIAPLAREILERARLEDTNPRALAVETAGRKVLAARRSGASMDYDALFAAMKERFGV